ncbi:MAG TPA: hypothetical protein PLP50_01785 [Thermoanaerobaculia bacterium]|nr:hypothetical protein [Thermoanaerobaculia bacterium]HQN06983.1 hypothetical protein [Thermoanaerobaculia bacterium]HQP84981.1 hypothetical protein [Thermoanaerobaculia bacterium]
MATEAAVRPFEARDRDDVVRICEETAFCDRGAAQLPCPGFVAAWFVRPYLDLEPRHAFVAVERGQEERVVGYVVGTPDTARFRRRSVPRALRILAALAVASREPGPRRLLRWLAGPGRREAPRIPLDRYPAHLHFNVLPLARSRQLAGLLLHTVVASFGEGATCIHGVTTTRRGESALPQRLMALGVADGAQILDETPSTFLPAVLGEQGEFVNRAWGVSIAEVLAVAARLQRPGLGRRSRPR